MRELVQWAREKNCCMSVPHVLNDNRSLPRWLKLINICHPIVTQLIVKHALKPICLLSGRNVQLLKASLSMQVTWRQKFEVTHYPSTKRLNRPDTYSSDKNFQPLYQNYISHIGIQDGERNSRWHRFLLMLAELTQDLAYLHVCNSCYSLFHICYGFCFSCLQCFCPPLLRTLI